MISELSDYIFSFFDPTDINENKSKLYYQRIKRYPTKFYYLSLLKNKNPYDDYEWHIQGLWPQLNMNNYPTFCRNVKFDMKKLSPLLMDLKKVWYSDKEQNEDFWKHEWEKHGTCMFKNMNEYDYFNAALTLYYEALTLNLPIRYYDPVTQKCLIPVSVALTFLI